MADQLSYRASESRTEFKHLPFQLVDYWAEKNPQKTALVFRASADDRESITFYDLKTSTERLALWFQSLGLVKGDFVGLLSLNRMSYALCNLALNRLGVITVRLYVTMDSKLELTRSLAKTNCRMLIVQNESLPSVRALIPAIDQHDSSLRLRVENLPDLEMVVSFRGKYSSSGCKVLPDWKTLLPSVSELDQLYHSQKRHTMDEDCTVYSTSGSTGIPKHVVHSHDSYLRFISGYIRRCGVKDDDVYFTDRPMAHMGGTIAACLVFGITQIVANPWKTITAADKPYLSTVFNEEKVSIGVAFPYFLYDLMMSETSSEPFGPHLRWVLFGGQLSNYEIIKAVKEKLKIPLVNAYGSTEVGEISCTFTDDSLETLVEGPGPNIELDIKIVDDSGEIVPVGVPGNICVRAERKWRYLNDEEKMAVTHDKDGFFQIGDMGKLKPDGRIIVLGRKDDVISVGTIKVYPMSLELKICEHPSVDKAQVFGVPDDRMFEVIGAAVLPIKGQALTKEDVLSLFSDSLNKSDLMTGDSLAPKFIWIEETFPLTSSGKVDKKSLKARCLEKLDSGRC